MAREQETTAQPWGTLDELLLACAVNRHGTKSWESVAVELQNRRSDALGWLTPQLCKDKFSDLKRRFMSQNDADSSASSLVPMVDQLRRIRVEELRREVQQSDDSIVSLELKVKKLEEERQRSLKEEADLGRDTNLSPEIVAGKPAVEEDSGERDDRSFNESNSTSQKPEPATEMVKNEENDVVEADAGLTGEEGRAQVKTEPDVRKEPDPVQPKNEPTGRRTDDDDENKKQSSDVQSSASLSKKKRRRNRGGGTGGSSSGEEPERDEVCPPNKRAMTVKSEPLIKLLGIIRSHRLGSAFERRQRSQESERYKTLIRQHIDLQIIQSRLETGLYSDCTAKFFRDLLLLFNNITIFYRKSSQEHIAAQELRELVCKEMMTLFPTKPVQEPATSVKSEPDKQRALLSKPTKSSTMVACGKRSSIKAITENASKKGDKKEREVEEKPKANEKKVDGSLVGIDEKGIRKKRSKERSVTGQRNSRTSNKSGEVKHEFGGNELSSHDTLELKTDKKESVVRKKQGAASFLKRMKQNSPSEVIENDNEDNDSEDHSKDGKGEEEKKGKGRKREVIKREKVTRSSGGRGARDESGKGKRGVGRPPKRAAAEPTTKRGRESGENEAGGRGKKRTRR
ncbi:hypothetical protein SLE2022_007100 [Rubroshorea leprosula]